MLPLIVELEVPHLGLQTQMCTALLVQIAELKGSSAGTEQQSQAAAQREKHEQQHLHDQNARLTAELAAVTEDRYELQVNSASGTGACKHYRNYGSWSHQDVMIQIRTWSSIARQLFYQL